MKYKIKFYIGGHLSMVTYRTDSLQNILSCARKSITLFSECDERVKICILDSDGNGIRSYVTGNKPKPVYTVIDHVNKERKTYYTGAQFFRKGKNFEDQTFTTFTGLNNRGIDLRYCRVQLHSNDFWVMWLELV